MPSLRDIGADLPLFSWARLNDQPSCRLVVAIEAKPTPRPRVTKTGIAFMPRDYQVYAAALQKMLAETHAGPPLVGPLAVRVCVTKTRPKSTVLPAPRGDTDNIVKGVLDACTKTARFWADDVQIVALFATKRWGDADEIEITTATLED